MAAVAACSPLGTDITWDTFDRMHQAMTAERAENQRQLDGERHNHEGTWA